MGCGGCECDVILNDYERVRLFDGVLFERHAYIADPRAPKALQLFRKGFGALRTSRGGAEAGWPALGLPPFSPPIRPSRPFPRKGSC